MARPEFNGRQFSIYAPSPESLVLWKTEAENRRMTLNGLVLEAIDSFLEQEPHVANKQTPEINQLRKDNLELKKENRRLVARVQEVGNALKSLGTSTQPDWSVIERLKKDGHWFTWEELIKGSKTTIRKGATTWVIVDAISGREKQVTGEPDEDEVTAFKDELMYTSIKILSKDVANKTLIIRPSDKAGTGDDIKIKRAKTISDTLERLENLGLVETSQRGWRWTR